MKFIQHHKIKAESFISEHCVIMLKSNYLIQKISNQTAKNMLKNVSKVIF